MSARYAHSPWSMPASAWLKAAKRVFTNISAHRLSITSAGVAFFGFLSIFPAIAAFVFIYGLVSDVSGLRAHLADLSDVLPKQAVEVMFARLEAVVSNENTAGFSLGLIVSLFIAVWSGSRGVAAVIEMIGVAYQQQDNRSMLRSAALSVVMTIGMIVMLATSLFLVAIIPVLLKYAFIPDVGAALVQWLRWPVALALFVSALCIAYKLAPDRRDARLIWLLPGALIAAVLWVVMSVLFSIYVDNFGNYDATFGSLSAIVVLLFWLYYTSFIVALGAELNAELELATRVDSTVGPSRPIGQREAFVADNVKTQDS